MREKKTKILIGVLFSLLLFASSLALFMYSKQSKMDQYTQESVEVYISTRFIPRGERIEVSALQKAHINKSYIDFTPLMDTEIVGRYASVDIYAKEPLRAEKITLKKPKSLQEDREGLEKKTAKKEKMLQQLNSDTIALSLELFKNIDYTLKKGDFIDIASVLPKKNKAKEYEFETKYIALHVEIDSFSNQTESLLSQPKESNSKKPLQAEPAKSIIVKMKPKEIKNFLHMYYTSQEINTQRVYNEKNQGHLWMIRCSDTLDERVQAQKEKLMLGAHTNTTLKPRVPTTPRVSIFYEN